MAELLFPWSDNWWIEENKAWFCGGEIGGLFCVNMENLQCEFIDCIPECAFFNFRLYSFCVKYKDKIFCMPSIGKCIWVYDMKTAKWEKIEVNNEGQISVCISAYKKNDRKIYFQDITGWMYETDLEKRQVKKIYCLPKKTAEMGRYVLLNGILYHLMDNKVCCIDTDNSIMDIKTYEISAANGQLFTICYDGTNFWLSGHSKEILVWNHQQGVLKKISEFPKKFGFYHFKEGEVPYLDCQSTFDMETSIFDDSIPLGKYVWFIPSRSSDIVYVDRETYEVHLLEIEEERETKESIENHYMDFKYLIVYIREDRYIGLYSLKNRLYFEIDTVECCVKKRNYKLSDQSIIYIMKTANLYHEGMIFSENRESDRSLFSFILRINNKKGNKQFANVGNTIYHTLN